MRHRVFRTTFHDGNGNRRGIMWSCGVRRAEKGGPPYGGPPCKHQLRWNLCTTPLLQRQVFAMPVQQMIFVTMYLCGLPPLQLCLRFHYPAPRRIRKPRTGIVRNFPFLFLPRHFKRTAERSCDEKPRIRAMMCTSPPCTACRRHRTRRERRPPEGIHDASHDAGTIRGGRRPLRGDDPWKRSGRWLRAGVGKDAIGRSENTGDETGKSGYRRPEPAVRGAN